MSQNPINEIDLQAYVDGQLDAEGRMAVSQYLVEHPAAAARIFADLRNAEALRLLAHQPPASDDVRALAGRLSRVWSVGRVRTLRRFGAMMAAASAGAIILFGVPHIRFGEPAQAAVPPFVAEAMMSHRTAELRARMPSQIEATAFDAADIRTATQLAIPRLPQDWRMRDVQLFPSDYGPSLQISVQTAEGEQLSLFAACAQTQAPPRPVVREMSGSRIAYWSRNEVIYVLSGAISANRMATIAEDLSDNQDAA